jgi:DUF1680 family protein
MENHGKYARFVYAHTDDELYVNLYTPSLLNWREKRVGVEQKTGFPEVPKSEMTLILDGPTEFELKLRWPAWVAQGEFEVRVNGELQQVEGKPSSYVSLKRVWQKGDRVEVTLPMDAHLEQLPDGSDYATMMYGPLVLSAQVATEDPPTFVADDGRMAHIASGAELPLESAPHLVGSLEEIGERIVPVPGKPLTFTAAEAIEPAEFKSLELVPFYRVHDARYVVYWRFGER